MAHRTRQLLTLLFASTLTACALPPPNDSLIGKSESAVRAQLGQPNQEFAGHYGMPASSFTRKHPGDVKTLLFKKWGQDIYVSFERRDSIWTAISNTSVPAGAQF